MGISLGLLFFALIASLLPGAGSYARFAVFAMLFSSIGDYVLGSPHLKARWGNPLPLGMLSFGLAHIFYIIGFSRQAGAKVFNLASLLMLLILAIWIMTFCMRRINEAPAAMRIGMLIYTGLICVMGIFAAGAAGAIGGAFWMAPIGALLFILSDSLILDEQASGGRVDRGLQIWMTYVPAQVLLILTAFFA